MRSAEEHRKLADEIAAPFENSTFALRQEAAEALREIAAAQDRTAAELHLALCKHLSPARPYLEKPRADAILSLVAPLLERAREEGLEAAARECDSRSNIYDPNDDEESALETECRACAWDIRSLRTTPTRFYTEAEMQAAVAAEREAAARDLNEAEEGVENLTKALSESTEDLRLALKRAWDLEADRDAWKAKYEAAIEALRPFAAWHSANVADWDLFEGHEPLEGGAASSAKVSDLRRAASLVSDHDRDRAKEASDAG